MLDFVFADGDDGVDETLYVLEIDVADALRAQAVGDGEGNLVGGELNDPAGAQAGLSVGGELGLDADYLNFGLRHFNGGGHAADQASASDGGEYGFDFG